MKALSLIQPWASFLFPKQWPMMQQSRQQKYFASILKVHETRSWRTNHRGTIAIHASVSKKKADEEIYYAICDALAAPMQPQGGSKLHFAFHDFKSMPRGAIIGIIELVDCQRTEDVKPDPTDAILGNFTPGRYAWRMAKPVLFRKPIPCRGSLGLWEVPIDLGNKLLDELESTLNS